MINNSLLLILLVLTLSQIECCPSSCDGIDCTQSPHCACCRNQQAANVASARTMAIAATTCAAGHACEDKFGGRIKRSTVAVKKEMRILLNTTYNFQMATSNMNKDPNNMDLYINNETLRALGVSQIIFGNDSNKLQIIFIQSEELIACNYVVTSLREFAKLNPSIVGAEILCAGKNQSTVVKGPDDGNVSATTHSSMSTTTKRPDPKCWWWIWKPHKKHQRPCWWWWYPNKHDQDSWMDFSDEEVEEAQNYGGWSEHLQDSYVPKSHAMHGGGGRQRRQASLPTESSLLVVVGTAIPYEVAMAYYDPVAVQNDTFYIATQWFLSAAGLSTKTYMEDDFGHLQIQFYIPKRSELCCNASKKAQSFLDEIDPFYGYSVRLYCGLEKPSLFKSQIPIENNTCLCQSGWTYFNRSCYMLNTNVTGLQFSAAESYCQNNYNAHLPSVHSAKEQEFISSLLSKEFNGTSEVKRIWNGLSLHRNRTIFGASWSDGSPVDFGNPVGMTPGTYPWGTSPTYGPEPQKDPTETQVAMAVRDRSLGKWVDRIPQTPADGILCRK